MFRHRSLIEQEVREESTSAFHGISHVYRNPACKYRSIADEGVELAIFSAGINSRGKGAKKFFVLELPRERRPKRRPNARKITLETESDHFVGEVDRVAFPDGKDRAHADFPEIRLTPIPQILQEQIAERDGLHTSCPASVHRCFHDSVVDFVRAPARITRWQVYLFKGKADRFRLFVQE